MRKRDLNPKALIALVVVAIGSLVVALLCKVHLFANSRWDMLLFWIVFLAISSVGALLVGKYFNKGGR